jgi:hypothetical protein
LNLEIIEHRQQWVLEAFRRGEFDQLEVIGEADEKEFFELCFQEKILAALAQEMPTARKKEEVPLWFELAANLSLKLHQENSYSALERVVQCGGLLSALPPDLASKHLDPQTQEIWIQCRGFNDKNTYPRKTPCAHDTLRKVAKDVADSRWQAWFNESVQQVFQKYGFFDPEGIFIGDATYLFVPHNPHYEGSVVMWFDGHNHPVEYDQLSPQERKTVHRERCYKLVSLLHVRGDCYVYAGLRLVPGNAHEGPVFYELVENFVRAVGQGVVKFLILDRGFIDGKNIGRCKQEWGIDVLIPMKRKMTIWEDAWALGQTEPWQSVPVKAPEPRLPIQPKPERIARAEAKRQRTLAERRPPPDPAKTQTHYDYCWIKGFRSWSELPVPINVFLMRDRYADGHAEEWALMSTRDYAQVERPRADYGLRVKIEERHRTLKCFHDLSEFHSRSLNVIAAQIVFILLSYTLRQWQLWRQHAEELSNRSPQSIHRRLNVRKQYIVIYWARSYAQIPLLQFTREVLQLEGEARQKALAKVRLLEQSWLSPFDDTC